MKNISITNIKSFEKEQNRIVGMMGVCKEKRPLDSIMESLSEQLEEDQKIAIGDCFLTDVDRFSYYSFRFVYKGNGKFHFEKIVKN